MTGSSQTSFTVFPRLGGYGGTNTGKAYLTTSWWRSWTRFPVGAEVTALYKETSTKQEFPPHIYRPHEGGWFAYLFSAIVFIVYYRYVTRHEDAVHEGAVTLQKARVAFIHRSFLRLFFLSITAPQCSIDVNLFSYWATNAAKHNFDIYNQVQGIDYPPGYMTILMLVGKVMNLFQCLRYASG